MATFEDDSVYRSETDGSYEDLELTLVQVAAAADARNKEEQVETIVAEDVEEKESNEVVYKKSKAEGAKLKRKLSEDEYKDGVQGNSKRKYPTKEENEGKDTYKIKEEDRLKFRRKIPKEDNDEYRQGCSQTKYIKQDTERVSLKQKREEPENLETIKGHAKVVATHYNALEEKGLDERSKSRIFYMRNFHNWIKSMLINEYLTKIKDGKKHNQPIRVHDMCCGKGGDLQKWRKGNITHLICSDIAEVSLEQCKTRYQDMKHRSHRDRSTGNIFSIEYVLGDCSRVRLREKYSDPSMDLDLVSCQFAFHYSFESLPQAECSIKNAAECLRPGGFFIGTIPDAYELMSRIHNLEEDTFGNNIFNVTFECDTTKPPLFGAKYRFYLDGVVNCPEFLVYFQLFVKLARKYGLKLIRTEKFRDFFERMKGEGKHLLTAMRSLETFPPQQGTQLVGTADDDYEHAKVCIEKEGRNMRVGTLSKSEWEASCKLKYFILIIN